MVMQTSGFADLLAPGLREIFMAKYKELAPEYVDFMNVETSERAYEDDYIMSGFGSVPEKTEGDNTSYVDAIAGGTKRYNHVSYGMGFKVTWEMWSDDLYGKMRNLTRELARSGRNLADVQGAGPFNNATSTVAKWTGAAGEALLSTTHALLGGGTASNRPASDTDISYAAVQQAIINFHALVDEQNLPLLIRPDLAVVTYSDQFVAAEIFNQETKPNTADRDMNFVRKMPGNLSKMMISHFITDLDRWFILSKSDNSLKFYWRERVGFDTGDDFDSKNTKVTMFARLSVGHTDWRGVYGAPGA